MTRRVSDAGSPPPDRHFDPAWRKASAEEPPAALDAAILAAAHREVGSVPRPVKPLAAPPTLRRWWPLAAAATLGAISFGLLQHVTPDQIGAPVAGNAVVTDVPESAQKPARDAVAPAASVARETARQNTEPAIAPKDPATPRADSPQAPPRTARTVAQPEARPAKRETSPEGTILPEPFPAKSLATPPATPQATPPPRDAVVVAGTNPTAAPAAGGRMAAPAPPMNAATAPAPPVQAAAAGDAFRVAPTAKLAAERAEAGPAVDTRAPARAPLPVDEWIALIRKLRAEGKQDEASRELVAFRAAHADHERLLPSDLRDWRPSGK